MIKKAKRICEKCGSQNLEARVTTFPVQINDRQTMNIGRVSVRICLNCNAMIPTDAGKAKIARLLMTFGAF